MSELGVSGSRDEAQELFRKLLSNARRVLVFTGAGVSTASGIRDYRGPRGVFRDRAPIYYQEFLASEATRREYWELKLEGFPALRDAEPNGVHQALVDLERAERLQCVVTQNVDGLHQKAGTSRQKLVELHGNNADVECVRCDFREPAARSLDEFARTREAPACPGCGALLKPAVVMFGQPLLREELARAFQASLDADLIVAVGSSLVVTPAAEVPLMGARRGTPYVILNQGETPHDQLATLRLEADASLLAQAIEATLRL